MVPPREPVFLARETYRRRRLIDAVRLVPVVGLLLFLAPQIGGGDAGRSTAVAGVFIFAVWFGLIAATAVLVRLLARAPEGVGSEPLEPEVALRTDAPDDPPGP